MDVISPKRRSYVMSRVRSSGTRPEILLRSYLRGTYLWYQPKIEGKPDFGSKGRKIAIFVDGCFWHKCPRCYRQPASNKRYWIMKIDRNVQRDREIGKKLKRQGWRVMRVWEHEILKNPKKIADRIRRLL